MNKFVYYFPSNYKCHLDVYNDALKECAKYCVQITYDLHPASIFEPIIFCRRSEDKIIFESDTFESLIVIYCILQKAEMEADRR